MDINNNTNVSNMVSQSLSRLNLNSLNRSYKVSQNEETDVKIKNEKVNDKESSSLTKEINLEEIKAKQGIDVKEIQQYASLVGENLSIEDINYGLMFGRSVIADYIA